MSQLDLTVYPDLDSPPTELVEPGERADYVHRICSAWDFGIVPERRTFDLFRGWRTTFDRYPIPRRRRTMRSDPASAGHGSKWLAS